MKQCNKCKQFKEDTEFDKCSNTKDGLYTSCKSCKKISNKLYKDKKREERKQWEKDNAALLLIEKEKLEVQRRERRRLYSIDYRLKNREQILANIKLRRQTDIVFRLNKVMSSSLYHALKDNKAEQHWEDLVPYNLQQLKEHIELQFTPEMTWNNYGEYWEVDHIIPQNTFSFTSHLDRDFQICWSLANLRPLNWLVNRQRPKDGSDVSEELRQKILNQFTD